MGQKKKPKNRSVVSNKQAYRDFHIEDTWEAGIELIGSEVKSIRAGRANLKGSFARIEKGEVYIINMHVSPYEYAHEEIDPVRPRKLLLHKRQIAHIIGKLEQKGYALVPIKIYFKRGYAKLEIGIGKGKRLYDKRHDLKKKEAEREMKRAMRAHNR